MVCRYLRHDRGTIRLKSIEFESRSIRIMSTPKKVGGSRTGYDHVHCHEPELNTTRPRLVLQSRLVFLICMAPKAKIPSIIEARLLILTVCVPQLRFFTLSLSVIPNLH